MPTEIDSIIAKLEWAAENGLSDFAWEACGKRIRIQRDAVPSATSESEPQQSDPDQKDTNIINAPMAGICHFSAESGGAPFVAIDDAVQNGQTICLIEAMKVMSTVVATTDGIVEAIVVEDGDSVDAGDILVRMRP